MYSHDLWSVSKSIVLPFHACSLLVYIVDQCQISQLHILLISIEIFLFSLERVSSGQGLIIHYVGYIWDSVSVDYRGMRGVL